MKIKILLTSLIVFLILVCFSQIFNIPPLNKDIINMYKSGYFEELDRESEIIADSFLAIKSMSSKAAFGWIFLADMAKKHNMEITVYNREGYPVSAPGQRGEKAETIKKLLDSLKAAPRSSIEGTMYKRVLPLKVKKQCRFCHKRINRNGTVGAISFLRGYDGHIYYSGERIIIFSVLAALLLVLLFFAVKWDPEKNIKELFDKS